MERKALGCAAATAAVKGSSCGISSWVPVLKDFFSASTLCSSSALGVGLVFIAPTPGPLLLKGVWSSEDGWRAGLAGTELVEPGEIGEWGPKNEKTRTRRPALCQNGAGVRGTALLRSAQEYEPPGGRHEFWTLQESSASDMVDMDKLINNLEVQLNSEGGSMQVFKQVTASVRNRDPPEIEYRSNMTSPTLLDANPMENPALFNDIKIEPPEELLASDFSLPQVEPVDLSFHKPKAPLQPASMLQAPIRPPKPQSSPQTLVVSTSTSDMSTSANIPTVLTPGSVLTSSQSTGSQQILHVIHTIPSVSLPNKMGGLKTIPVVVQSLPMVYTTLPADGGPAAITVPLIGGDGKNAGSVKVDPTSMSPLEIPSDSEESTIESGSSALQSLQGLQQEREAL
ncbi:Krueppel-like factor 8 isoform X2 [Pan troglodytes]|nr:Krueppel-like factor 8 isoform X2 [Pan troglodytes]